MRRFFIVLGIVLIGFIEGYAATITSKANANWNSTSTWDLNRIPIAGDIVILKHNVLLQNATPTVGLTINAGKTLTINAGGILNFSTLSQAGNIILNSSGSMSGGNVTMSSGLLTLNNSSSVSIGDITITSGAITCNNTSSLTSGNITNTGSIAMNSSSVISLISLVNNGSFSNSGGVTVHLTGDLINNNSFSDANGGVTSFEGLTQNIVGQIDFSNISVNDGTSVSLDDAAVVSLNGYLLLQGTSSMFDADGPSGTGLFTVNSTDATLGGRILALPDPTTFTGVITLQRLVPGNINGDYRYLSSPVSTGNLGLWQTAFGVTGNFSDPSTNADFGNINDAGNANASVFKWDIATQSYTPLSSPGNPVASVLLLPTEGYVAYDFNPNDYTVNYVDVIQKGDIPMAISNNPNDFNLLPNPYPSPIDWDNVTALDRGGLNNSISLRTSNNTFTTYINGTATLPPYGGWSGEIATGQSFWTQSSGGNTTFTMHEQYKTSSTAQFLRTETPNNYVRISLNSPSQKDETIIRFYKDATDGQDQFYDATKRRNGNYVSALGQYNYVNISSFTVSDTKDYAINGIAEVSACSKTIGLKIMDVAAGDYTLKFTDLASFTLGYSIILVDHFLNKEIAVSDNFTYPFNATSDAASFGSSRFEIRFEKTATSKPTITAEGLTLKSSNAEGNQWYKDGAAILGATESSIKATESGVYTVKTTIKGCSSTSENITLSITGVSEVSDVACVYPNPSTGVVTIKLPQDEDGTLKSLSVYDLMGSQVISSDREASLLKPGEKSIDLSNVKSGVYILNLNSKVKVRSIRLIKK